MDVNINSYMHINATAVINNKHNLLLLSLTFSRVEKEKSSRHRVFNKIIFCVLSDIQFSICKRDDWQLWVITVAHCFPLKIDKYKLYCKRKMFLIHECIYNMSNWNYTGANCSINVGF